MGSRSQHISIGIGRPASEVYDFTADPLNLPTWAAGLAGSKVERDAAAVVKDLATLKSLLETG